MLTYTPSVAPLAYFPDLDMVVGHYMSAESEPAHALVVIPRPYLLEDEKQDFGDKSVRKWTLWNTDDREELNSRAEDIVEELRSFVRDGRLLDETWKIVEKNLKLDPQKEDLYAAETSLWDAARTLKKQEATDLIARISRDHNIEAPGFVRQNGPISVTMKSAVALGFTGTALVAGFASMFVAFLTTLHQNIGLSIVVSLAAAAAGAAPPLAMAYGLVRHANRGAQYTPGNHKVVYRSLRITDHMTMHETAHSIDQKAYNGAETDRVFPGHGPRFAIINEALPRQYGSDTLRAAADGFAQACDFADLKAQRFLAMHPDMPVIRTAPSTKAASQYQVRRVR